MMGLEGGVYLCWCGIPIRLAEGIDLCDESLAI
jgi:hypothetical protein